jgi:molybdate transport system substrate-binding protein
MSSLPLTGISSMATRLLLADLAVAWSRRSGRELRFESVGGVDAARRVAAGEAFDLVVLASEAIDRLQAAGHVVAGSRADLVRSAVAVAVRAGAPKPDIGSEAALRDTVLAARGIGYSTGPSGTALLQLFERWGLSEILRDRLRQASPGVAVGSMVAQGEVELGFQQRSELIALPGIDVIGAMPAGCDIVTVFSAGLCARTAQIDAARALIAFLQSPDTAELKRRHGMEPA